MRNRPAARSARRRTRAAVRPAGARTRWSPRGPRGPAGHGRAGRSRRERPVPVPDARWRDPTGGGLLLGLEVGEERLEVARDDGLGELLEGLTLCSRGELVLDDVRRATVLDHLLDGRSAGALGHLGDVHIRAVRELAALAEQDLLSLLGRKEGDEGLRR